MIINDEDKKKTDVNQIVLKNENNLEQKLDELKVISKSESVPRFQKEIIWKYEVKQKEKLYLKEQR